MAYISLEDAAVNGWEVERQYLCHAHPDTNASASLNANGKFICYACGDRGRLDMDSVHQTPEGLKRLVKSVEDKLFPTHRTYTESWLDIFDGNGPGDYWLSRFDEETCQHYRLGRTAQRPVYPMRDNEGLVLGVVYREFDGRAKYLYPRGVKVSNHLFDIHRVSTEYLILTEGATDAMAAWEVGFPATASYRNGLSDAQVALIRRYSPTTLWVSYDADAAGERGFVSIQKQLPEMSVKRMMWRGHKDLSAMPKNIREKVLAQVLR